MGTTCPTQEELKSLSLGQLSDEQSDRLIIHLNDCQPCQSEMGTLETAEDTFVAQLRSASDGIDGDSLIDELHSETECRIAAARALGALAEVETGATTNPKPNVPRNIGEYEVVQPLGHGGMGHVYLGRHTKLNRTVAIKFIAEHRRWDKNMHERFASEMRTIGSLNHPNIVVAHDAREVDGLAVLVTEFIDGLDVSELLRRNGQLSIADSVAIVQEVCHALKYIDSKNLVHRDIKPSNIMIDNEGSVKLLDLGLAKLQADDEQGEFTATGQAIGTADYVAPEQINDGRNVDIRADIYGLGCSLYKLLAGRAPFALPQHSTAFAKMNAHVSETPEPIEGLRSDIPKPLAKLVHRMLEKSPADRPQTADEVLKLISSVANSDDLKKSESLAALVKTSRSLPSNRTESQPLNAEANGKPVSGLQTEPSFGKRIPWAAIASTLLALAFGIWLGIILTIKKPNGEAAKLIIPDGAIAIVDADGNVEVTLADSSERATIPAANVERRSLPDSIARDPGSLNCKRAPSGLTGSMPVEDGSASSAADSTGGQLGNNKITFTIPQDSPIRGKVEVGDFVDVIGMPGLQTDRFKSGNWPDLIAKKIKVQSISTDKKTRLEQIEGFVKNHEARKLSSLSDEMKAQLRFHDASRPLIMDDFGKLDGAWRTVLRRLRYNGSEKTATDIDNPVVFSRNKFFSIGGNSDPFFNFTCESFKSQGGSEIINVLSVFKVAALAVGEKEKLIQRSQYRILSSGKLELAGSTDMTSLTDFENADMVMRFERIVNPKTANEEQAVARFEAATAPDHFEISIGTSQAIQGVTVSGPPIEISNAVRYGLALEDDALPASKETNEQDPSLPEPSPVRANVVEQKTKVWMGPRLITSRDVTKAEAYRIESSWGVLVELTDLGSQKIAYMTEKFKGEFLPVAIDGKVVYCPEIHSTIESDASLMIHTRSTKEEAEEIARQIVKKDKAGLNLNADSGSLDKLKQLALACLFYESDHLHFPASAEVIKKHPVSWRVLILPHIEQNELYKQYRQDEPWDSDHNKQLIVKMPDAFRHPNSPNDSTTTDYVGFASDETALGVKEGNDLAKFEDGTSNTILFFESKTDIPWTKPVDIEFDDTLKDKFSPISRNGLNVVFADASTETLKPPVPTAELRRFFTRSGNDGVDRSEYSIE